MNLESFTTYAPLLIDGAIVTVTIVLSAVVCATVLGAAIALMRVSHNRIAAGFAAVYVWFFRGIPSLLALFFAYYALPQFGVSLSAFQAGLAGMTVTSAAFVSEILRAGIQTIDPRQMEAAVAIGMGPIRRAVRVGVPHVLRSVTPPYISNAVIVMKESAQLSVITVPDLMLQAQKAYNATYSPLETLGLAAVLYLLLTSVLMAGQQLIERRMKVRTR